MNEINNLNNAEEFITFMTILGSSLLIISVIGFILYLFYSFGVYKILKNSNLNDMAWFSFIPVINIFLMGKLIENEVNKFFKGKVLIILSLLSLLSLSFQLFLIPLFLFQVYVIFFFYKKYSKNYIIMFLLSIMSFGLLIPIFVFSIRNNKINFPLMEERTTSILCEEDCKVDSKL